MIEEQLTRAKSLLGAATKATGIVNARALVKAAPGMEDINGHSQDYEKATDLVRQAAAELTGAKQLAVDLKGALAAKQKGDDAIAPAAFPIALKALGKEVEAARSADHADVFPDLYKTMDTGLAEAKKLLDTNKLQDMSTQLKIVGEALVAARTGQAEHGRFKTTYDPLVVKLTALTTSTVPPAAKLKDKTDPLVAALKTADEQDKARNWTKAFAALNAAQNAAKEAEQASAARALHDANRLPIFNKANALPTGTVKTETLDMIGKADAAADKFNFSHAQQFLDNAGVRIEGEGVKTLAKTNPPDIAKIEAAVQRMLDKVGGDALMPGPTASPVQLPNAKPGTPKKIPGGPELVDQLVASLDDTVPAEVIIAIAKKRFGIDLQVSRMTTRGGVVMEVIPSGTAPVREDVAFQDYTKRNESARNLYNTLAMTPAQSDRNPSLKTVQRTNAMQFNETTKAAQSAVDGGGAYSGIANVTTMQGRPGASTQKFGANELGEDGAPQIPVPPPRPWDEKTAKEQKELEVYRLANDDPVDDFEFANVHETGHSTDDRMSFMLSRLRNPAFGDWDLHGGDFGAIATPVAAHYAKLAKVPDAAGAMKQFVIDTMTGGSPEIPVVDPDKQEGVNEACNKIKTEWYPNANVGAKPWWSQSKCDTITMDDGRIYQESYAGRWSSYAAAERKKGVTGYQFRAPGEWFAELFAAYHYGKLKPGHPARKWLSSLQL